MLKKEILKENLTQSQMNQTRLGKDNTLDKKNFDQIMSLTTKNKTKKRFHLGDYHKKKNKTLMFKSSFNEDIKNKT